MPRRGRKKGGSIKEKALDALKKANEVLRETQILSNIASKVGKDGLAEAVASAGYGRRRRRRAPRARGRGQAGGSIFGDILGKVISVPAGVAMGSIAGLHGAVSGLGRRRGRGATVTNENRKVILG